MSSTEAPTPAPELNQLDEIRGFVLFLMSVDALAILYCAIWTFLHRQARIVKAHQPIFLITICVGLFIWALAVLPLSMDDSILSPENCSRACMAQNWLAAMGYTICFAALYSKLFRINKLFHNPQFRRIKVEAKDVMVPFVILFTVNFVVLLAWTVVDPLQWERKPIRDEEDWNTFGSCTNDDGLGGIFAAFIGLVTLVALILVIRQAWKARDISREFSESRNLAIGLYNWLQLLVLGTPLEILLGNENPPASYALEGSFLLAETFSMLLVIFVPIFLRFRQDRRRQDDTRGNTTVSTTGQVRVTGLSSNGGTTTASAMEEGEDDSSTEMIELKTQLIALKKRNEELEGLLLRSDEEVATTE